MHISYRSYLKSCNYRCPYCPFGKFKETEKQVEKDKKALEKFYQFIKKQTSIISLFFTPYGEILGKEYYWEYFAELSKIPTITEIGCQTNNSFSVDTALSIFDGRYGNRSKLRLWCTYHPDMASEEYFLKNCKKLENEKIQYSVGMVAQGGRIEEISAIREKLPSSVYLWCNAIEGTAYQYTEIELEKLRNIDPYFQNECTHIKADMKKCIGGREAVLIEANGDYYHCHISREKIGNIYDNIEQMKLEKILKKQVSQCKARECSCYLAYRLRVDMREYLTKNFFYRL